MLCDGSVLYLACCVIGHFRRAYRDVLPLAPRSALSGQGIYSAVRGVVFLYWTEANEKGLLRIFRCAKYNPHRPTGGAPLPKGPYFLALPSPHSNFHLAHVSDSGASGSTRRFTSGPVAISKSVRAVTDLSQRRSEGPDAMSELQTETTQKRIAKHRHGGRIPTGVLRGKANAS